MKSPKPFPRFAALLNVVAMAFCFAPSLAAQSAPAGTIEGRAINAAARTNLKQVHVVIDGTALETFTNEAGEFRLTGVPAGEVSVRASVAGLATQTARARRIRRSHRSIRR